MRVSTNQMQTSGTNAMLDRYSELSRTQEQLSTGLRITKPSDDPVGFTQILPLREAIAVNEQYNRNSDAAEARLKLEDSTLGSAIDIMIRVNELSIQANSNTISADGRSMIAEEIEQNLATLMGLANSRDSSGEYIFAGDDVTTQPFTEAPAGTFNYNGDNGQRNLQIGSTRQIAVGDPGDDVFVNLAFSGGGTQNIFETIDNYITNIRANTPDPNVITDLKTAMDNFSTFRAKVGSRLNAIDSHRELNEELILQGKATVSRIEDLDIADAVSRLNMQLVGLQASQQTFSRVQNLSLFNYL